MANERPVRDGKLQNALDADANNITNVGQLGVGTAASPTAAIHLSPGGTPTTQAEGLRIGSDVTAYRDATGYMDIVATGLKVNGALIAAGDLTYSHTQGAASATWNINHALGRNPSVTVVDSGNDIVEGDISYTDLNNLVITFSATFSGNAYLN